MDIHVLNNLLFFVIKRNVDLGLNNAETYVLTDNRFKNNMVLIFTDFKKTQIYQIPYRNRRHQEIEKFMSFN